MKLFLALMVAFSLVACGKKTEQPKDEAKGASTNVSQTVQTISSAELAKNDGKDGRPAWVAYKGKVYDVSAVPAWKTGTHKGNAAGQDITSQLASSPHGASVFGKLTPIGEYKK
jgi:predicted heme/steroid binding protein